MWVTVLLALGILLVLLLIVIAVSDRNIPTWRGAIISTLLGLLHAYLILCLLGVMGRPRERKNLLTKTE